MIFKNIISFNTIIYIIFILGQSMKRYFLFIILIISYTIAIASSNQLRSFTATYIAKLHNISIGTATRTLTITPNHLYNFTFVTNANIPFVSLKLTQISQGEWTKKGPHPVTYIYKYQLFGQKHLEIARFDWMKHIVNTTRDKKRYILHFNQTHALYDKLSYQLSIRENLLQNRKNFTYLIAGKRNIHHISLKQIGYQKIKTPLGIINAITITEKDHTPNKPYTVFWLAPKKYDFLLLKIAQIQNGHTLSEAYLKSVQWK